MDSNLYLTKFGKKVILLFIFGDNMSTLKVGSLSVEELNASKELLHQLFEEVKTGEFNHVYKE